MLRKSFSINKKITKAEAVISGLGHYVLTVNGKRVGDALFAPLWSDYDKTVYYNTLDIKSLLGNGENVIGVTLGNGFYNAVGNRYRKLWISFGPPTLYFVLHLTFNDGSKQTLVSDSSWKFAPSPITFNDIYGGEDYDARLEQVGWNMPDFIDSEWNEAVVQEAPQGVLRPQMLNPVRKMEEFPVKSVVKIDDSYIYDMGQNLSGYPSIKVKGKRGDTVKITVGERLDESTGKVSQKQSGSPHFYTYTLKGEEVEEWHPEFSYYGFRYVQIDGSPVLDVKSHFIHNSAPETGSFECSNPLLNKTHLLIKNAVKSNMQAVFTDCPHREKLGWLEETHLCGRVLLYNWDMRRFFPKIMQDIADAQQDDGLVPSIAPEYVEFGDKTNPFRDSPEWGIASIMLPAMYYQFYGETSLMQNYFEVMLKYVDYLTSRANNHILSHGLGDWYDYGEHRAGLAKNSPVEVSATAHYFYAAHLFSCMAKLIGREDEAVKYGNLAKQIREAFNSRFYHPETSQYANGSQFCNAIAIYMDIVEPDNKKAVLENLKVDIIKHGYRLTTGDVGNRYLFMALALNGENELLYKMINHEDAPGYGFQLKFGATTLTEQWDPRNGNSWNHFMMGQIDEWFYRSLAGIEPSNQGFQKFTIHPRPVGDLKYVKASYNSPYGLISVEWRIEKNFRIKITVPKNAQATVVLPDGSSRIANSGKHVFSCVI